MVEEKGTAELPEVLTTAQVAELLHLSRRTVEYHARKRNIPARKVGGQWRFSKAAIMEHLATG